MFRESRGLLYMCCIICILVLTVDEIALISLNVYIYMDMFYIFHIP